MKYDQLYSEIKKKNTCLCVGLDTNLDLIPTHIKSLQHPIFQFNKQIVDSTAPYCVAYKLNTAFYEAEGVEGWLQMKMSVDYIRTNYPNVFIIADAKRGDIGNTAARYAKAFFEEMDFDAITLAPYMGKDSVDPFLKYKNKWVIILALTSNSSADQFETLKLEDGTTLYENVMTEMMDLCSESQEKVMFVVGATRAEKLADIRKICPNHFLLVPGIGSQGGSLEEVTKYGLNKHCGLLINASRSIIYASKGEDFAVMAAEEAKKLGSLF